MSAIIKSQARRKEPHSGETPEQALKRMRETFEPFAAWCERKRNRTGPRPNKGRRGRK